MGTIGKGRGGGQNGKRNVDAIMEWYRNLVTNFK